jgi:DNA invertase Pin-like site-specific DNA recombinase
MLLLDLVCHIAQTDEAVTTLRSFARSLTGFEKRYRLTMSGALERILSSERMKRQHRRTEQAGAARRAVAYIRESTEEQERGYSPDGQRQAIARYADEHGLELVEEYLDFETGREADKRAGFQRLIEDAMAHKFECVLIFHTSRFARNTIEAKRYKKLLRSELGIDVISVTQPLGTDVDDPAAFLSESVHEIFDEYYSVSLSFWTKMGLREKARQGLLTGGLAWGLLKGEEGSPSPTQRRRHTCSRCSRCTRPASTPIARSRSG